MVMHCNSCSCVISHFVNFVTNELADACRFGAKTVRRPAFPANSPATGADADPHCRELGLFSLLYHPVRAEPAAIWVCDSPSCWRIRRKRGPTNSFRAETTGIR